jgi:excisionase family DNA binding protein
MKTPTITQLRAGPPSVDLLTAAAVLGLGRTKAYELARRGEFPVRILRIGGSYRVPTAALLELLGISETTPRAG